MGTKLSKQNRHFNVTHDSVTAPASTGEKDFVHSIVSNIKEKMPVIEQQIYKEPMRKGI